jgi:APA family basic amino acid/polyamine antiporter
VTGATLARDLGLTETTALVIGGIIGASIFAVPAAAARETGAPGLALLAWILAGLLATCGALCFAELAAAIPETGGTYVFLKRAYPGVPIAFLFGWTMFFATSAGAIATVATIAATYAGHFLSAVMPYGKWEPRILASLVILSLAGVNYVGVRMGGKAQNALTALKVAMILLIIVLGLAFSGRGNGSLSPMLPAGRGTGAMLTSLGAAMLLTLFSFSGWIFPSHVAGEVKDPARTMPIAILVGLAVVLVLNVSINVAFMLILPFDKLAASPRVASDAMQVLFGPAGASLTALAVMISGLGTVNAQILNYPRIAFALSRDGLFFKHLGEVHPNHRTPANAILAIAVVACLYALAGTYTQILSYVGFVGHLFLTLAVGGVIVLRIREPNLHRPYRTWGYPVTPILFIAISIFYLSTLLVHSLLPSLVGITLMILALPFYLYWKGKREPHVS